MSVALWVSLVIGIAAVVWLVARGSRSEAATRAGDGADDTTAAAPEQSAAKARQSSRGASAAPATVEWPRIDPALFAAAERGDATEVARLVGEGANASLRNAEWVSPLGVAIARGHREVVRALLEAGVDPNAPALEDEPALFVAASYQQGQLMPELVAAGAHLAFILPGMGSALSVAIAKSDREAAQWLLDAGIPVDLPSAGGARALHVAAMTGQRELVELLLAAGASVDCPNYQGGTPLRSAAAGGHAEVVRMLLAAGADPSPVDAFEMRPIDYAHEQGHDEVVQILEQAQPAPTAPCDCPAENPLSYTLPARTDATLKSVMQARKEGLTFTRGAASALEAPSMIAAARTVAGPGFNVEFSVEGEPDPRLPVRPVDFALWTYETDGVLTNEARPARPRPPDTILERVARVAEYPYLLATWSSAAAKAAQDLHTDELRPVLATMVHPPPAPDYIEPWDWRLRVQVAAALIASHMGSEPWAGSARRRTLEDVLDGPADWAITAVIIALLDVGRRDAGALPLVIDALARTARRPLSPPVYQHAVRPAAHALLELPQTGAELAREMTELVAAV